MNPNIYQEKIGIWFSLLWSFIITGAIVFVDGNLYCGFSDAYPGIYDHKLWFYSIPIFVCMVLLFHRIKYERRREVERLEQHKDNLSEEISDLQRKQRATLDELRRLK
jgi:hypothetical protein